MPEETEKTVEAVRKVAQTEGERESERENKSERGSERDRESESERERERKAEPETGESVAGSPLSALLGNPALLSKLPDMVAVLKPLMGASGGATVKDKAFDSAASGTASSSAKTQKGSGETSAAGTSPGERQRHDTSGAGKGAASSPGHKQRVALLLALRPYLSPARREVIDYMLRMDKLGDLFRDL